MRSRAPLAAVLLSIAGLALLLRAFPPDRFAFYPGCPLRALTGLLCPFCGGTHALSALFAGRWGEAVRLNALVAAGTLLLIVRLAWVMVRRSGVVIPARAVPYLGAGTAIFAFVRNM